MLNLENKIFFIIALFMFLAFILLQIFSYFYLRKVNNKINTFKGNAEGEVKEILSGWGNGVKGKVTDKFMVYSYWVNGIEYVVMPLVTNKDSEINQKYFDSVNMVCTTYFGPRSGTRQTRYTQGEKLAIKYDANNPKNHVILEDKDLAFMINVVRIVSGINLIMAVIFLVLGFFIK